MKFGVCSAIETISKVEAMGFDYLEANASKLADLSEEEFCKQEELVKEANIPCECFNVLFPKTMAIVGPNKDWEKTAMYLERVFSRIKRLGGKIVVFGSGKCRNCPAEISFAEGNRQLVEAVRRTGEIAAKYGVTVVIEPLNQGETNLICSVPEGAMLMAEADRENVQLLADSFHMFCEKEPLSNISRVRSLAHTHVALREGRAYPTEATDELKEFFRQLAAIRYQGRMSIEGKTADFEADAPKALALLRSLEETSRND